MSTEILGLEEISQTDTDKFTTHNEALRQIEAQLGRVLSRTNGGPPVSPVSGDTYIVDVAVDDWSAATVGDIAHSYGGAWYFYPPVEGAQKLWVNDEDVLVTHDSTGWIVLSGEAATLIANGTSSVEIPSSGGDVEVTVAGGLITTVDVDGILLDGTLRVGAGAVNPTVGAVSGGGVHTVSSGAGYPWTLSDSGYSHTFPSMDPNTYGAFGQLGANGGLAMIGSAAGDNIAAAIVGYSESPVNNPALYLNGIKSDGAGNVANITGTDPVLVIASGTPRAIYRGNGNLEILGTLSAGAEASPDVDSGGLCLQQNSGSGAILTAKSTIFSHGMTTRAEADTYFRMSKYSAVNGGTWLRGFGASNVGLLIQSETASVSSGDTTASGIILDTRKQSGTSTIALGATENLITIGTDLFTKVAVKGNGDIVTQGGIRLSGGATKLANYEEGTWTPAITFETPGDLSVTYSPAIGEYVRIGRTVIVNFSLATTTFTHTTASGPFRLTGLPFTSANVSGMRWTGDLSYRGINVSGYTSLIPVITSSLTYIAFDASAMNVGITSVTATLSHVPSGGQVILRGSVTYRV